MDFTVPEKQTFDRETVVQELRLGLELATQLQAVLNLPDGDGEKLKSPEILVGKILESFTAALATLNPGESLYQSQSPASAGPSSSFPGDRRSRDSDGEKEISAYKNRRGGSKRSRKPLQTWRRVSATPLDDGYAWRKYGQKHILNTDFPRSYFRCTRRNDQGCFATKQVQKISENPPMFHVTYAGLHTCGDFCKVSKPECVSGSNPGSSCFINFESSSFQQELPFSSFTQSKQKDAEEVFTALTHDHLLKDLLLPDRLSSGATMEPLTAASDVDDVISGVHSSSGSSTFDMGMIVGSCDLDDIFHFDEFH